MHTSVGMLTLLCAHACMGIIEPLIAYTRGHDRAYVCIYAWTLPRLCVHILAAHVRIRAGMMALLCAYACRHDCTVVCICVQGQRLCVHVRGGMIAPMCAYTHGMIAPTSTHTCVEDSTFVCIYAWE